MSNKSRNKYSLLSSFKKRIKNLFPVDGIPQTVPYMEIFGTIFYHNINKIMYFVSGYMDELNIDFIIGSS